MTSNTVPVVDIKRLDHPDTLAELDLACREWGFFQVENHGIPRDVIERVFAQARKFFDLPAAAKRAVMRTRENPHGFYDRELTKNRLDLKEIYDYGPAQDAVVRPQWPRHMPTFRAAVLAHYRHAKGLGLRLLRAILANLGASPDSFDRDFGRGHTSFLRLNYYPVAPASASAQQAGSLGVGQHTDAGGLTLLLQDDQPGLEVFRNNAWHLVEPRRDAIVVNIGDIVQVWSNDLYFAALHRVIASTERPRYSIPYFMSPAWRMNYAPLPSTVSASRPARYREINWGEFLTRRTDGDYADFGEEIQVEHFRISA